jgi:hypothetical protein
VKTPRARWERAGERLVVKLWCLYPSCDHLNEIDTHCMYLTHIQFSNYKAFPKGRLDLSRSLNLLVGPNNAGKSAIISAIAHMQGLSLADPLRIEADKSRVEIGLVLEQGESLGGNALRKVVRSDGTLTATYAHEQPGARTVSGGGTQTGFENFSATHPNNAFVPYLSGRRVNSYAEEVSHANAYTQLGHHQHAVSKIDSVYNSAELRPDYESACNAVLGFVPTPHASVNGKMIGYEVSAKRQQRIPLAQLGAGVVQAAALIADLVLMEGKVFLIEEPENDLHPKALRALLEVVLSRAVSRNQFIISTHSNFVVRALGGGADAKVFQVEPVLPNRVPTSTITEVSRDASARLEVLRSLGYLISDLEMFDAFLILEESSAERIIRQYLIPWFVPNLGGRLRTVAAQGAGAVEPAFSDFHRLFLFLHLQPVYEGRAWVLVDGDAAGHKAIALLKEKYNTWQPDHFQSFSKPDFECFYPPRFENQVATVLAIQDRKARKDAKAVLLKDLITWLDGNPDDGRQDLEKSCAEVIAILRSFPIGQSLRV